jgi:hypothetical protein
VNQYLYCFLCEQVLLFFVGTCTVFLLQVLLQVKQKQTHNAVIFLQMSSSETDSDSESESDDV